MATILDAIVTPMLRTLNICGAVDAPEAEDAALALEITNRIFDSWNADRNASWAERFDDFVFTPSLNPHTIGPSSATWATTLRPVSIEWASVGLNNVSPTVYTPINVRDYNWYKQQAVPGLTTTMPTDVYYQPDVANGKLYFWGIPTVAYGCRLWYRTVLAQVTLATTFTMPPGYLDAVINTGAEMCTLPFRRPLPPLLEKLARKARARIFDNNIIIPRIATQDSGMPGQSMGGGNFNWRSRSWNS